MAEKDEMKKLIEAGGIAAKWSVSLLSYVHCLIINGILVYTRPFLLCLRLQSSSFSL